MAETLSLAKTCVFTIWQNSVLEENIDLRSYDYGVIKNITLREK